MPDASLDGTENMGWLLYTRRGCHLCEEAEDLVAAWLLPVDVVDVDGDTDALQAYGAKVPVLLRDDTVVMEGRFDERRLAAMLTSRG